MRLYGIFVSQNMALALRYLMDAQHRSHGKRVCCCERMEHWYIAKSVVAVAVDSGTNKQKPVYRFWILDNKKL